MEKFLFLCKFFKESSSNIAKRQFITIISISIVTTLLFSVQPVIMSHLVNTVETKEFGLSLAVIMLAISYIALMSMRKLSAALNFILITSLRNKIIISITDSYFKSLFN